MVATSTFICTWDTTQVPGLAQVLELVGSQESAGRFPMVAAGTRYQTARDGYRSWSLGPPSVGLVPAGRIMEARTSVPPSSTVVLRRWLLLPPLLPIFSQGSTHVPTMNQETAVSNPTPESSSPGNIQKERESGDAQSLARSVVGPSCRRSARAALLCLMLQSCL